MPKTFLSPYLHFHESRKEKSCLKNGRGQNKKKEINSTKKRESDDDSEMVVSATFCIHDFALLLFFHNNFLSLKN